MKQRFNTLLLVLFCFFTTVVAQNGRSSSYYRNGNSYVKIDEVIATNTFYGQTMTTVAYFVTLCEPSFGHYFKSCTRASGGGGYNYYSAEGKYICTSSGSNVTVNGIAFSRISETDFNAMPSAVDNVFRAMVMRDAQNSMKGLSYTWYGCQNGNVMFGSWNGWNNGVVAPSTGGGYNSGGTSGNSSNTRVCHLCHGSGSCTAVGTYPSCRGTGVCPYCNGRGWCSNSYGNGTYNCPNCDSPGINNNYSSRPGNGKCSTCHGTGRCHRCGGTGRLQ